METNYCKTNASFEWTASNRIGDVEFWDGGLTLLWAHFGFKQFGIVDGSQRK